jgi:hypothetical protein
MRPLQIPLQIGEKQRQPVAPARNQLCTMFSRRFNNLSDKGARWQERANVPCRELVGLQPDIILATGTITVALQRERSHVG